jgi:hypothetical protein
VKTLPEQRFTLWLAVAALGQVPTSAAPMLSITNLTPSPGAAVIQWTAETNAYGNLYFTLQGAATPGSKFANLSAPISENSSLSCTDSVLAAGNAAFYRIAAAPAFTTLGQAGALASYGATNVSGLATLGYSGAVFDGRYVYFVPYQNSSGLHGRVLRYDTQASFSGAASWTAYDATVAVGAAAVGFTGAIFDGRYIYFCPASTAAHPGVLRLDTTGNFTNAASWALYDASSTDGYSCRGFQGTAFDGRYVYFVPHYNTNFTAGGWNGLVLRYDTQSAFTNAASWHAYDAGGTSGRSALGFSSGVFDGRYVYFVPVVNGVQTNGSGVVLRYDSQSAFTNSASWLAYDAGNTGGLIATGFKCSVFDGRYLYFSPYPMTGNCVVLRYDTQTAFTNSAAWTAFNANNTSGLQSEGYDGIEFDGRYVYFVPYRDSGDTFHGRVLRYDTQNIFTNGASWQAIDAGNTGGLATRGFIGAVSDGRYIYFAPYYNGTGYSGNILRFDSRLPRAIPPTVIGGSTL